MVNVFFQLMFEPVIAVAVVLNALSFVYPVVGSVETVLPETFCLYTLMV